MPSSGSAPVLILTGPPGVGKTTVAEILAERSPRAVHLEADVFFRFIHSGYVEPWKVESHEQNRTVMRIVGEAAIGYAAAGYFTIVDGIVIPGWFLAPLRDSIWEAGQEVALAVLRAPCSTCVERVRARDGVPLADSAIEQLWRSFADLGELEPNAIDAGDATPEQIADVLAAKLGAGRLKL